MSPTGRQYLFPKIVTKVFKFAVVRIKFETNFILIKFSSFKIEGGII